MTVLRMLGIGVSEGWHRSGAGRYEVCQRSCTETRPIGGLFEVSSSAPLGHVGDHSWVVRRPGTDRGLRPVRSGSFADWRTTRTRLAWRKLLPAEFDATHRSAEAVRAGRYLAVSLWLWPGCRPVRSCRPAARPGTRSDLVSCGWSSSRRANPAAVGHHDLLPGPAVAVPGRSARSAGRRSPAPPPRNRPRPGPRRGRPQGRVQLESHPSAPSSAQRYAGEGSADGRVAGAGGRPGRREPAVLIGGDGMLQR